MIKQTLAFSSQFIFIYLHSCLLQYHPFTDTHFSLLRDSQFVVFHAQHIEPISPLGKGLYK